MNERAKKPLTALALILLSLTILFAAGNCHKNGGAPVPTPHPEKTLQPTAAPLPETSLPDTGGARPGS